MKKRHERKRAYVPDLSNVVLVLLGLAIALGSLELLMRAFPNLIPPGVRVNPPARRVKALIDEPYDLRQSDGDLYLLAAKTINEYIKEMLPATASKIPGHSR